LDYNSIRLKGNSKFGAADPVSIRLKYYSEYGVAFYSDLVIEAVFLLHPKSSAMRKFR
jgi:hypothetical protein